jgi:hypothetical protein
VEIFPPNHSSAIELGAITEELTVLYDGQPIGRLAVIQRTTRKIHGRLIPGLRFDVCQAHFEQAAKWFSQWEATSQIPAMDYVAWDHWIEVISAITARICLPEVSQTVEEFAVDNTAVVEITLLASGHG